LIAGRLARLGASRPFYHGLLGAGAALLLTAALVDAQLFKLMREQVVEITADNPFERFPDGRPKVPDALIEQAKGLSAEDIWAVLPGKNYRNQWADGFQLLHPGTKMAGRAFTAQFMPTRPDIMGALTANATKAGIASYTHQYALDQLQPGDVFVADVFGKGAEGTIVGDNLFYYVHKATRGGGLVVDGSVRDLEGLSDIPMPAYFRHAHPTPIREVMLTGINVPIRIGEATVSPGDLVLGDREGVYFIPPSLVQGILDRADETHIHDEWTKRKFDEGKYKSQEIYGSPRDPALKKEYEDYLAKKLAELKAQRAQKK
jgi:4-hydroxy-4-methyl-2-oxoglutarate aldolase